MRSRRLLFAAVCLLSCMATAGVASAQSPFVGTWKLNQEKSQLAGNTIKFDPAAGQGIELTSRGTKYSFRMDGKSYRLPSGNLAVWREGAPDSWTTEYRTPDGKLLSIDHWKLSSDSKNLSLTNSGVKANGDLYTNTEEYARTAGTTGLMGSWKSTQVKLSSPNELTIQESGLDGLTLKIAALKVTCEARFGGKDVAIEGPDISPGLRLGLTRTGPSSFRVVEKLNGSQISSSKFTVSADAKTMTEIGNVPGDPPTTKIWEKQ